MEAAATDVPHIAKVDALITVNRCWFPEAFVISESEEHRDEGGSLPQSVSVFKQTHLPRK